MRYTNDTVEYVKDLGREHTLEESLTIIQKKYPSLDMTLQKLEEMRDKYLIRFVRNDLGIFTEKEVNTLNRLVQTCANMKEVYNIFVGMYTDKCDYKTFLKETSKLSIMSIYNTQDDRNKFTPLEEIYIEELLDDNLDNASLFAEFNSVFPNKYPYLQFVSKLNELKIEKLGGKSTKINNYKGRQPNKETLELVDYLKSIQGDYTIDEYLEMIHKDDRFVNYDYKKLHKIISKYNITFKKKTNLGRKGTKKAIIPEEDAIKLRSLAERGLSVPKIKEEIDKVSDTFRDIAEITFRRRLKDLGITPSSKSKASKSGSERGIYNKIYNDVVVTVEGNTIEKALKELQEKHPDLASEMGVQSLRQFAYRHKLNYIQGYKGRKKHSEQKQENNVTESTGVKRRGKVSEHGDAIYERLKILAPNYTKKECHEIINKEFGTNYSETYIYDLTKKRGELNFKVYTEFDKEMEEFITHLINDGVNKRDIYLEFCKAYPGKFTAAVFYPNLKNLELKLKGKIVIHNTGKSLNNTDNQVEPIEQNMEPVQIKSNEEDLSQFQPIIDEVNSVFEKKCSQLGISGDTHAHTDELINALEIIINYAKNKNNIIRLTNDHEDVLEQYRREVEHEIELQPFQSTDTYCQNKLKVIGMRRREVKYTRDDLNIMNILLKNISENIEAYDKTLESLKHRQNQRENSIFIPLVDTSMTKKYDWCKNGTWSCRKVYTPILKTNAKIDRINNIKSKGSKNIWTEQETPEQSNLDQVGKPDKNAHKISTYRVKAEFLVLKGNPFVNKYYDVKATNEDLAVEKGKEYFDLISSNNNNAQYTITDVTRLNR